MIKGSDWEFANSLLNKCKLHQWAVLHWAIWKVVCWTLSKTTDNKRRRELVHQIVDYEINHWLEKA